MIPSIGNLQSMPKIELHVHLESTIEASRLARYAAAQGKRLPREGDAFYNACTAEDLSNFLAFLDSICAMVGREEDLEDVAYHCAMNFAADGIVYAETILNPTHWPQFSIPAIISAVSRGFSRGKNDGGADCRLLLSLDRGQSENEAMNLVQEMIKHGTKELVGLSIDGNEQLSGSNNERFASAFLAAHEAGFGCTAHAGESSGAQGVIEALDILHVDRIDHGVRSVEDATLIARLAREKTVLNVCVSSNLALMYDDESKHPLKALHQSGVATTLNRDDPTFLGGLTLKDELVRSAMLANLTMEDLFAMQQTAVDAAFCDEVTKERLRCVLQEWKGACGLF